MLAPMKRAVRVVMLEERHERRGDRDELLGRHVNVVDFRLVDEDEVALAAGINDILHDVQLGIELDCWPARWCGDLLPTQRGRS